MHRILLKEFYITQFNKSCELNDHFTVVRRLYTNFNNQGSRRGKSKGQNEERETRPRPPSTGRTPPSAGRSPVPPLLSDAGRAPRWGVRAVWTVLTELPPVRPLALAVCSGAPGDPPRATSHGLDAEAAMGISCLLPSQALKSFAKQHHFHSFVLL